ncbi:anthranilate phosphoribosyltransferase [Neptunicella marina]|uniref:Anthranilate phosphoribosyltransferase n=1 Tax=Neptunicella marina TaxID=2125989 RepID=A0A8J6ISA8_9ALTE|nr:anthranilate phosphoribosyltransferase [Neptunicella marina]MBC3764673.1 anthranilate phosphoribosyltransferase [Neptunicella marina]
MQALYEQLYQGKSLTQPQSQQFFNQVVKGEVDDISLAAMLTALKFRGETPAEIAGAAAALIDNATAFPRPDYQFTDIVGTGGDGHNTINISSASAIVAAACGLKVAKHGNRSVSSKSGSADLFNAFGLDLMMAPDTARACLDQANFCFLFAPCYHAGIKHAMPVRTQLKSRTIFNLLGPLANPARPSHMMIGVYHADLLMPFAKTLQLLGYTDAMVVHGNGLDEIALHGSSEIVTLKDGDFNAITVDHSDFGLPHFELSAIEGGEPEHNKMLIEAVLAGKGAAAHEAAVAANVATLLKLNGKVETFKQGAELAMDTIKSGKALQTIQQAAEISRG